MPLVRQQVELHLPGRLYAPVVVLLRGDAADRLRRVHSASDVLAGAVGVFDLVVYGRDMLTSPDALVVPVAVALASVAGLAQLFSP